MRTRWLAPLSLALLLALEACAGVSGVRSTPAAPAHPADPMLDMLNDELGKLESGLQGLPKRIETLKNMPDTDDPTWREIRALDIAGWELHLQQWRIQRDHLRYAESQLQRVKEHPEQKAQILDDWMKHEREFEASIRDFRDERHELERKRLQAEARLIERHFR